MRCRYVLSVVASIILGLVFTIAGAGKLLNLAETDSIPYSPDAVSLAPILASGFSAWFPPVVELILGLLLIIGVATRLMATFSSVLIAIYIGYNGWMIGHGRAYEPCGCLGIFDRIFAGDLSTMQSLFIDVGLLILAAIILFACPGDFFAIRPRFLKSSKRAGSLEGRKVT